MKVAYFSMEYAIDQALKTYSGGLGFLAGSYLRSCHDLRKDVVGVGILWTYGYYDQTRDDDGAPQIQFARKRYSFLEDTGIKVSVRIFTGSVWVKVYKLRPETFGTSPLYLLTTDIPENDHLSRSITKRLYDANQLTRLAQQIVLGIGGEKALHALSIKPDIYHINEAHALPLAFYLYDKMQDAELLKKHLVFTTHTPEKAGNEVTSFQLLSEIGYFNGLPNNVVRNITRMYDNTLDHTLSALRLSGKANSVSKIHRDTVQQMWKDFEYVKDIISITNAQHKGYWGDAELENAARENNMEKLLSRKRELKRRLLEVVADQSGDLFNPDVLTIVWARRMTGYKRPGIFLQDAVRFLKLLSDTNMPVQIVWAGKPYPEDASGRMLMMELYNASLAYPNCTFLAGYDLALSKILKQGADIWLNTPRYTREASGTSGMTAAMNGAINCSIADGWVAEFAMDHENSFVIPHADLSLPLREQDTQDSVMLYDVLEKYVIPTYYHNKTKWAQLMMNSIREITPAFDSDRMVKEYFALLYNADH